MKVFHNFHQILMASELQVFVLVRVTVNAPLVTGTRVNVNAALDYQATKSRQYNGISLIILSLHVYATRPVQ